MYDIKLIMPKSSESYEKVLLQDSKLTTFRITAKIMTMDALTFITENLKQVRSMVFFVEEIILKAGLGTAEEKNILNNLELYALNMKSVKIRYTYTVALNPPT